MTNEELSKVFNLYSEMGSMGLSSFINAVDSIQSDAVEFYYWAENNRTNLDFQEQHNHTSKELYQIYLNRNTK